MKGDKQTGALVDIKGWAVCFIQKRKGDKKIDALVAIKG